jgi:chaperone BCS1
MMLQEFRQKRMRVGRLANEFAVMVPELTFSPAEILSFLLGYRHSPGEVIINVERWMARIRSNARRQRMMLEDPQSYEILSLKITF